LEHKETWYKAEKLMTITYLQEIDAIKEQNTLNRSKKIEYISISVLSKNDIILLSALLAE
jgi:hypothetical protein